MDNNIPIIEQDNDHNKNRMALAMNISSEPLNRFVPSTFREAFDITWCHLWMPAMKNEIEWWDNHGVVMAVPHPEGIKTIKEKWVFDLKADGDRNLLQRRVRGVVKGFMQKFGEHWWNLLIMSLAPLWALRSWRLLNLNWLMHTKSLILIAQTKFSGWLSSTIHRAMFPYTNDLQS
jgi:hypothetical protein